jgi:hypothetical protein
MHESEFKTINIQIYGLGNHIIKCNIFYIIIFYIMSGNLTNTSTTVSNLGGGIPGSQPKLLGGGANSTGGTGMVGGGERSLSRAYLRRAFGNSWLTSSIQSPNYYVINKQSKTTPFRAIMSAGDINGTVNQSGSRNLPTINQVRAPRVQGTQNITGGPRNDGNSYFTGNPKYVYDSSTYTKYKQLKSVNKTYDDKSFGGSNNGSYSFLLAVRR